MTNKKGSLINVGLGMTLGSHLTPLSRSYIENADVVFVAASDSLIEEWVKGMNKDVRSLQGYYQEGMSRMVTYRNAIEAIMTEVRMGKNVCGAFYGHPGVFSWAPHESVKIAQAEGYHAHMEAGVSAEDCLYADLGIDPGKVGCTHFEATQFMCNHRQFDPSAYLILWQISVVGDKSLTRFSTPAKNRQILVNVLLHTYPKDHQVIIYECSVLPIDKARRDIIQLKNLPKQTISQKSTLVIPPKHSYAANEEVIKQLDNLKSMC